MFISDDSFTSESRESFAFIQSPSSPSLPSDSYASPTQSRDSSSSSILSRSLYNSHPTQSRGSLSAMIPYFNPSKPRDSFFSSRLSRNPYSTPSLYSNFSPSISGEYPSYTMSSNSRFHPRNTGSKFKTNPYSNNNNKRNRLSHFSRNRFSPNPYLYSDMESAASNIYNEPSEMKPEPSDMDTRTRTSFFQEGMYPTSELPTDHYSSSFSTSSSTQLGSDMDQLDSYRSPSSPLDPYRSPSRPLDSYISPSRRWEPGWTEAGYRPLVQPQEFF